MGGLGSGFYMRVEIVVVGVFGYLVGLFGLWWLLEGVFMEVGCGWVVGWVDECVFVWGLGFGWGLWVVVVCGGIWDVGLYLL